MSLEMAHKVILPPKKNYIPQFLKQRDINSYFSCVWSCFDFVMKLVYIKNFLLLIFVFFRLQYHC
jgi:hypothetical protein